MKRLALLYAASAAGAAEVADATGRAIVTPGRIERTLPAGPPAAVLFAAMVGKPGHDRGTSTSTPSKP